MREALLDICTRHILGGAREVTVKEPYIPYIPPVWNRRLVLAEAQNHGTKSSDYLKWLRGLDSRDCMLRLYLREGEVGCQPWDDGSLKLAIASAFGDDPGHWAVSNAVLWSRVDGQGRNGEPSDVAERLSIPVWREFLGVLQPEWIVTAGTKAREVIDGTGYQCRRLSLTSASASCLSRVSGLFGEEDLLSRYPEVSELMGSRPDPMSGGYRPYGAPFLHQGRAGVPRPLPPTRVPRNHARKMPVARLRGP